ncbi:MAG: acetyltransferase [Spirochaetota bacterium]|nr:acetyltransferase [Spirochaetota bacterium]
MILWGGIGQAKLVRPIVELHGSNIVAVFDDNNEIPTPFPDVPIYYGWDNFESWIKEQDRSEIGFCIGIGGSRGRIRLELHEKMQELGLYSVTIAHSSAVIPDDAQIGDGSHIMAGVIIGPEVQIGKQCIINAKASIDHESVLEDGVEISPGATLCGGVTAGINVWIAAGATVLPGINIGNDAVVGAGAVVTKDVPEGTTVVGVPSKPIIRK